MSGEEETRPLLDRPRDEMANPPTSNPGVADESAGDDAAAVARRVLRKIDRAIIPLLFITYMLNFMDKVILSSAAVFGLKEDTVSPPSPPAPRALLISANKQHLHGQQYSWVASVFYLGYLTWSYPAALVVARLPVGKYLAANTALWGAAVAATAACTSFGGLLAVRILLGVAEASIAPGFMFVTSTWYTRDEMPARVGVWFAGNSVGGLVSSLLAFAVGHVHDEVHPWRWMYIILGAATFLWTVPTFFLLPDSISTAKFLTTEEREVATRRTVVAGTGSTEGARFSREQVRECLVDPKTWLIVCIAALGQIPNSGTQSFANIIVKSFHFTSLQSTLVNIPYSLLSAAIIAGTGWLAGRHRTLNCILIVAVVLPCVAGAAVIYRRRQVPSRGAQLLAYFLLSPGPASMPLNMALVQSNFKGVTKKMTMTALLFVAYCAGNVAGPQFFRESEAPTYDTAFQTIMICYSLVIVLAIVLRMYLQWFNALRSKMEGVQGSLATAGALPDAKLGSDAGATAVQLQPAAFEDITDWKTVGFRYRL
ncbi:Major facilitator superfamily domain, general substrate transporter [Cordyceps fumosorosea ARSEF 2679]|uniref:Major facilitator superfamily domain, general substrate transporter n=1 Tax=Cordyceps fumosorosea (strain ARSEF 2679) TaxID=1081104 RepID=A0A167LCS4_CORFA|nr:Major facilitator superfamily domain, general substrate transporter [Cordyceps fumosorosea ARSEF 2679]OAA52936.1 Major facilitator superfamily domain, general substrate transporter [Cordyceps fumosorosea ARSEF 2679]